MEKLRILSTLGMLWVVPMVAHADLKSTTGTLKLDADGIGNADVTINSTGLGIGTTPSANLHVAGNSLISGSLSIVDTTSSSNLALDGSIGFSLQTISSNTTVTHSHAIVDTSAGNLELRLPLDVQGRFITI